MYYRLRLFPISTKVEDQAKYLKEISGREIKSADKKKINPDMSIEDFISIFESIMMPEAIPTYISKDSLMFYPTERDGIWFALYSQRTNLPNCRENSETSTTGSWRQSET